MCVCVCVCVCVCESEREREGARTLVSSWILTSRQPQRVTSGNLHRVGRMMAKHNSSYL